MREQTSKQSKFCLKYLFYNEWFRGWLYRRHSCSNQALCTLICRLTNLVWISYQQALFTDFEVFCQEHDSFLYMYMWLSSAFDICKCILIWIRFRFSTFGVETVKLIFTSNNVYVINKYYIRKKKIYNYKLKKRARKFLLFLNFNI